MEEGSLVAIRAADSPKIVAVGQLAAGKKELLQLDGKGKAVITVSWLVLLACAHLTPLSVRSCMLEATTFGSQARESNRRLW